MQAEGYQAGAALLPFGDLRVVLVGRDPAIAMTGALFRALGAAVTGIPSPADRREAAELNDRDPFVRLYLDSDDAEASPAEPGSARSRLAEADIVLATGAAPDVLGVSVTALAAGGTVVVRVTPWGERGPRAGDAGSELVLQAASGLVNLVGDPGREPLMLGGHQAAYSTGMQAFTAAVIALHDRDRTGTGQEVRTSYLESLAYLEWKGGVYFQADGTVLGRGQSTGPLVLPAADGYLALYYRDVDWPQVVALFGDDRLSDPRFATMPLRIAHEEELRSILTEGTQIRSKHTLYHAAQRLGIPAGSVETIPDLKKSEQYAAQGFLQAARLEGGRRALVPSLPFTFNRRRFAVSRSGNPEVPRARHGKTKLSTAMEEEPLPLEDVRVLDLGTITAGAATSSVLADFGADVIKVESPSHVDPFRAWTQIMSKGTADYDSSPPFHTVNRNKSSVGIDLKTAEGRELLLRLAAESDIVVENFRRGVLDRLGLGFEALRAANPAVVLLSLTSQGISGPDARYGSFGSTLDALGGLMSVTGYDDLSPTWSSNNVNYPDQLVSFLAPGAALAALRQARRSGEAIWVDFSQREAVSFAIGEQFIRHALTGIVPAPAGNRSEGMVQGVYPSGEPSRWVAVSVPDAPEEVGRLLAAIGLADDTTAPGSADPGLAERSLADWVRARSADDAEAVLRRAGITASVVRNAKEVLDDPQLDALGFFQPVRSRMGDSVQRGFIARLARTPARVRRPAPDLGQDTERVLTRLLGLTRADLDRLLESKAIYQSQPH